MSDLSTSYMGLKLKNPVIIGANDLVKDVGFMKKMEDHGAAAIVYKSLFEEQVELERLQLAEELSQYNDRHAEMIRLFPDIRHSGPSEHLYKLRKGVESVTIPVIASLNCVFEETWVEYARLIEQTGVKAIELNFYAIPGDFKNEGKMLVNEQLDIISQVKSNLRIPVSVKLSPFYSNILNVIRQMYYAGIEGFVLFNRLFQPDIDLDRQQHCYTNYLSQEGDYRLSLRYIGLLFGEIRGSLCANTGIFTGEDAAKVILTGADCVQVVSTIYKNGFGQIGKILKSLEEWMEHKEYDTLSQFKGKLSKKRLTDPFAYKRAQYIDILMKGEEVFKRYPVR